MSAEPLFLALDTSSVKPRAHLQRSVPLESQLVPTLKPGAETAANDVISRAVENISNPIWRLEIAKHAEQHQVPTLAMAQRLFDAAGNARGKSHIEVDHRVAKDTLFAVRAMSGHGAVDRLIWCVRFAAAFFAGFVLNLLLVLSSGRRPQLSEQDRKRPMIAVHAECSNRTRHVLPPRFHCGERPVFLLLGRLRTPWKSIPRLLDPDNIYPDKKFISSVSMRMVFASIPSVLEHFRTGFSVTKQHPVRLPFRTLIAIAYRFSRGATQAEWWRRNGAKSPLVIFGHTGLADCTQLEQAMQAAGTKTVHYVHGVSHGWNFAALSDLGLFNSKHDAELAKQIGGYGEIGFVPEACPGAGDNAVRSNRSNGDWLLLTSYSHPMNPEYLTNGVTADLEVLELVASAVQRAGNPFKRLVWRPHPAIHDLPERHQLALRAVATSLGFIEWPTQDEYETIGNYDTVFSTPSTAALDTLRAGRNPIIVSIAPVQKDSIYAQMTSIEALSTSTIEHLSSPDEIAKTWSKIRPGRAISSFQDLDNVQFIKR